MIKESKEQSRTVAGKEGREMRGKRDYSRSKRNREEKRGAGLGGE